MNLSAESNQAHAFIESFNGRLRDELLNGELFMGILDARRKLEAWRRDYNQNRPHGSASVYEQKHRIGYVKLGRERTLLRGSTIWPLLSSPVPLRRTAVA